MARDAFVETDARGVLTEWNRQSEVLFGWSCDEVLGRCITEFLIPERHHAAVLDELESAGRVGRTMGRTRPRQPGPVAPRGIRGPGPGLRLHRRVRGRPAHRRVPLRPGRGQGRRGGPGPCVPLRLADRPAQPDAVHLPPGLRAGQGHERPGFGRRARARPRPLQGHQRRVGPRGRRRVAGGRGGAPRGRRRHRRCHRPAGRRRVPCPLRRGRRRERRRRLRAAGAPRPAGPDRRPATARSSSRPASGWPAPVAPRDRGHAAALQRRRGHVPGQDARRRERRGLRRGHAHAGARPHAHRALAAPGPRAPRAAALLPTGGGDPRGRAVGVEALLRWEHPEHGPGGPQQVHPRGRGERPHHPHRRLGAARGVPPAVHVAGRPSRRAPGCGRGQPVGPADRPPRDRRHGRADPRRHRAAPGQPDPGDHRERADERRRLGAAGAAGPQGPRA